MGYNSVLRGGLFVFECSRFAFLTMALNVLRRGAQIDFPWLLYAVPNALFPLMLLFLWLDFPKYRVYEPLYKSGKCMCMCAVLGWYFFELRAGLDAAGNPDFFNLIRIMVVLLAVDLFTVIVAVVLSYKIKKDVRAGEAAGQEGW